MFSAKIMYDLFKHDNEQNLFDFSLCFFFLEFFIVLKGLEITVEICNNNATLLPFKQG